MVIHLLQPSPYPHPHPHLSFHPKLPTFLPLSSPSHYPSRLSPPLLRRNLLLDDCGHRPRRRRPKVAAFLNLEAAKSVAEAAGVLAAIIVVHESGHFLAAYLQGIHVTKFAVGFGPVVAKFDANNVEYSLRAFPLGGFVGFPDNDPDSGIAPDDADLLKNRPILDRVLVISAGVVANAAFAYLIILAQVASLGLPVQTPSPGVLVSEVRADSAAARAGLSSGDVVLAAADAPLPAAVPDSISKLVDVIKDSPGKKVALRVRRKGEDIRIEVTPDSNSDQTGRIGVPLSPNMKIERLRPQNPIQALSISAREFWVLSLNVVDGLRQTFLNFAESASKVSGPVAIIAVGAEVARSGSDGLFQFAAVLNLNLAVINLLPLPALDGGSLALILIEAARGGRKLPQEVEQRIMSSGIALVILLGLFLIVKDTLNLEFIKDLL